MPDPRSKEDFDAWYNQFQGDPWGYQDATIRSRLHDSLAFIRSRLGTGYAGTFLEFGAFDGSFTVLLAKTFPQANIVANDISSVAMDQLKIKVQGLPRVSVVMGDMVSFATLSLPKPTGPLAILLLECLYYLPADEQAAFLLQLRKVFGEFTLFLSAPLSGGKYYDENSLRKLLADTGYRVESRRVLNLVRPLPRFLRIIRAVNISSYFRRRFANQVIHCIRPCT